MCGPAEAAAGLKVVQGIQTHNTKVAMYDSKIAANTATRRSAISSRDLQIQQNILRNEQEQNRIADEKLIKMAEAYKKEASYKTAVGEDNIVGRTVLRSINLRVADRLRDMNKLDDTGEAITAQSLIDARGIQAQLEGRLAQIVDPVQPDPFAAIVNTAVDAGTSYAAVGGDTTWSDVGEGLGF